MTERDEEIAAAGGATLGPGDIDSDMPIALYRALVEQNADLLVLVDRLGVVIYVSPSIGGLFGYEPDEVLGTSVFDYLMPEDQSIALDAFGTLMQHVDHDRILVRFRSKSGEWRRVEVLGSVHENQSQQGMILSVRDVTERNALLEQAERSEALFRAAFNAAAAVCCISVLDTGEFIDVNESWIESTGWSRDEAIGRTALELNVWGSEENRNSVIDALAEQGKLRQFPASITAKAGRIHRYLIDAEVVVVDGERRMFISATDVTERELLQQQLYQSQRMEAVGQLTGGIAHDFNNMLTVILGQADLALRANRGGQELTQPLEAIRKAADRGAALIQQLMIFSRRQILHPETVNVSEVVKGMAQLITGSLGDEVEFRIENNLSQNWSCNLDQGLLESAVLNLILNARDAMLDGGELVLRFSECVVAHDDFSGSRAKPGEYVQLDVIDNGVGMDDATVSMAFEPFFTTKPVGRGTGLGLSMVFGFVKQSGGHIKIDSLPGQGTSVRILMPRNAESSPREVKPVQARGDLSGRTILVVEDSTELRLVLRSLLESLGCNVIESSGADIEQVLASCDDPIDLLLSDVILPDGLKGSRVERLVLAQHPSAQTVFMSGYSRDRLVGEELLIDAPLLKKPFTKNELAEKLSLLLSSPR